MSDSKPPAPAPPPEPRALAEPLHAVGDSVDVLAAILPEPAATVARALAAAARFASALAARGLDPVEHIARVQDADPALQAAEKAWRAELDQRFPK